MNITGIIAEYNPFHNGHIYHIQKAKEITDCDLMIAVCSGNFTQRGEISVLDKFQKTKAALENGVDIVVELPLAWTLQNGSIFGEHAVSILKQMKITDLVFGSETNNLEKLSKMASLPIQIDYLKEILSTGISYPKAYGLLTAALYPNDLLGLSYMKAIGESGIKPHTIARTNEYHSLELTDISSAKAIRKALQEGRDYSCATPVIIKEPLFNQDLYPQFRRILFTSNRSDLQKMHLVNEGIEKRIMDCAMQCADYEEFLQTCSSRRYTYSRIKRTMISILLSLKKEEIASLPQQDFIRVLGFNQKGQEYLSSLKKEVALITQFKKMPEAYKQIEWKASCLYASYRKDFNSFLKQELKGPIILKEKASS